ncbi:tyrosin kinase, putative [Entamoeba histolytica HM-1:IMSS-B]|uniref:Protein kinase, putative n=6 Tax=Entamoeba histolytica TaxID=5759 RepID=C4M935_ENTH1|nr:protein kinase, putative [Entamoeba histolytica HM-1:IMSS]EMD43227.1 MAP3K delta 1 protein kinase, putative [Entamoeba histolytica KU27]EMH74017.1 tyrosin kinase, putative [Entamoeba histolytica HM-1:IMSS-B]EMS12174.1 map3k delta-1 protein kinase [Entamoeba histolytica HM-3:IMSS]ENY64495.1 map3k delta-1 protein kinase, putative [Entamoeba histolytica HM-1:IMSS-A]GAT98150.1 tyrosin kinase putative [Entamoeba histolytica]|eukprot:XP_649425.1 protein kinase, putative [Entamoeba histolytica HM-1:IMSS]
MTKLPHFKLIIFFYFAWSYAFTQNFKFISTKQADQCDGIECNTYDKFSFKSNYLDCSNDSGTTLFDDLTFDLTLPPRAFITSQELLMNVSTYYDVYSPPTKFALLINNNPTQFTISAETWNDECESCVIKKAFVLSPFGRTFINGTNSMKLIGYSNIVCVSEIEINISYRILYPVITRIIPSLGPIEGGTNVSVISKLMYPEYRYLCCFDEECNPMLPTKDEEVGTCLSPEGLKKGDSFISVRFQDFGIDEHYIVNKDIVFTYYNITLVNASIIENAGRYYLMIGCEGMVTTEGALCKITDKDNLINSTILKGKVQGGNVICIFPETFDIEEEEGKTYLITISINLIDYCKQQLEFVIHDDSPHESRSYLTVIVVVIFGILLVGVVIGFLIFNKAKKKTEDGEYINPDEVVLEEIMGSGSYGDVYSALWRGQEIAVKLIPTKNMLQDSVLQFTKEVQLMKKLRHPCVLQFFGSGTDANFILIAMELMRRGSAHTLLMNKSLPINWERRLRMLKDAASGMFYLHSLTPPIIHLDLKSHNLLVDDNWKVKVSDFGLSMTSIEGLHSNSVCGTLAWTAPEMLKGKPVSTKADVYSYAIVMWEFLARADPYPDIPRFHLIEKVGEIGIRPDIPQNNHIAYCELMQRCWETRPEDRPDFSEILVYLDEFIKEEINKNLISETPSLYEEDEE